MALIVLASYPKSGNTWLRALVTNYFSGTDQPADLNALLGSYAFTHSRFRNTTGLDPLLLSRSEQDAWRPEIARAAASEAERVFIKAHEAFQKTPCGTPQFPPDAVNHVIYVVRDPREVAMAFSYHLNRSPSAAVSRMNADRGAMINKTMLIERMGSWSDHVTSWMDQSILPVTLVRYEDLQSDPTATFTQVITAIDPAPDTDRISWAIAQSDHRVLRRQEQDSGFREMNPLAKSFFSRIQDQQSSELPADQQVRLIARHGPIMQRFGYTWGMDSAAGCADPSKHLA